MWDHHTRLEVDLVLRVQHQWCLQGDEKGITLSSDERRGRDVNSLQQASLGKDLLQINQTPHGTQLNLRGWEGQGGLREEAKAV